MTALDKDRYPAPTSRNPTLSIRSSGGNHEEFIRAYGERGYRADVLVEDEKIVVVGTDLSGDGAETVNASGKLVMPGFIDAHTHMDMPFGGTVTADDRATGTAAAAGGTTTIIDFALQEEGGTLAGAVEAWTEKARGKALVDYGFHVAITDLRDDVKT